MLGTLWLEGMTMRITTTYKHNAHGRPQILAKGGGRQKTTDVDLSKSDAANHGAAAGALAAVVGQPYQGVTIMLNMDNGNARFELN